MKDDGEVARIEAGGVDRRRGARRRAAAAGASGPTEQEFGLELDTEIRRLGADGNSFETIVGVGPERRQAPPPARRRGASSRATSS